MRRAGVVVLAFAAVSGACGGSTPAATTPTVLAPVTTETFSGTVDPLGSASHTFVISQLGEVDVTLTAAGPPSTIFMGLGIGAPSATDGSCALFTNGVVNTQGSATPQLVGTASAGSLCVKVFDIGNQTAPVSYTITVAHT